MLFQNQQKSEIYDEKPPTRETKFIRCAITTIIHHIEHLITLLISAER